ncbi:MAG: dTDP-4-dehydrorhamnose 3,5-epimerase [Deltaproteobacteria bacterium]|nr:dTDP-4-dehydrorhamnose 3,5-epimerase [Deltaproteobacteria bacterium]
MKIFETDLPGVLLIEPQVFADARGFFFESWRQDRYDAQGLPASFVQDNISVSAGNVLRGLHFQHPYAQGKLIQALHGEIFDVAVDVRVGSPTFAQWIGMVLSAENHRQLYIPGGFAHGFCVTSGTSVVWYKCTDFYHPQSEGGVLWNDPDLGIEWPVPAPILSPRDAAYLPLRAISEQRLPVYERSIVKGMT